MFTGLVEETSRVEKIEERGEGKQITLNSETLAESERGESISISGACLTVEETGDNYAEFFLSEETLEKTWFGEIEEGDLVNYERSLKPDDRMGGHLVQGHVEGVSEVMDVEELEEGWNMKFSKSPELENYIVKKGFITVEGISLTVTEESEDYFAITVIPETWEVTNLSEKKEGDKVNLETDVIARYVEKMV